MQPPRSEWAENDWAVSIIARESAAAGQPHVVAGALTDERGRRLFIHVSNASESSN